MRVMSVMNLKGGSSKSTTVVHASVEAVRRGLRVLIVDTDDPQYSASMWARARGGDTPAIIAAPAGKLAGVLNKARADGFDLVLIDTSPRLGPNAVDVARLSDRVIVPVKPDPFDLLAVQETLEVIKREQTQALLFLSCCPPNAPEVAQTRAVLVASGLPVAAASIGLRRTFTRAVLTGKSAAEYEPKGKAAAEMAALMNEVLA
jgi:chromosome partitioning protein